MISVIPPILVVMLAIPAPCAQARGGQPAPRTGDSVILVLQGGREVAGAYIGRKDGAVWIALDQGEIGIDAKTIVETRVAKSDVSEFRERRRALKKNDVEGHFALAKWARGKGLEASAVAEAKHVLALDPSHRLAHFFLGRINVNGKWLSREQAAKLGLEEHNGHWSDRRARR